MAATDRLELRCTAEEKELMRAAASARGLSLSGFALAVLLPEAKETLRQERDFRLSRAEQSRFVKLLLKPPPPSDRLRHAYDEYRRNVE